MDSPPDLNISTLKHKIDISNLTIRVHGESVRSMGRFYMLWRNGNFIVIQAEPWLRLGLHETLAGDDMERRALWYIDEVLQTMLDNIVFDGENNWAYIVRLKDNTYCLQYAKRRLINNCMIWTKVVELDDIEVTRFKSGLFWEGIYEGEEVDLFIGWQDYWAPWVSCESHGQRVVESRGVSHYFFQLKAHVSKNGVIIGIMMEALIGRCVTPADRAAVCEAISDIQRHGIFFIFQICDIYITERGVRFASASSAKYYSDQDALAEEAEWTWKSLADMFNHMDEDPLQGQLSGSRSRNSSAVIIPRLPSPSRPIDLTPEEARIRWLWSITTSEESCRLHFAKLRRLHGSSGPSTTRRDRRLLISPDDSSDDREVSNATNETMDKPLVVRRGAVARQYPYARPRSKRLLLPSPESNL